MKKINQTYYQQCTFRPFCFVSCADAFLSITSTRNYPPKIVKRQMWDALQRSDLKKNWWKYTKLHFYGLTNQRTAFFEWKESGHQQQTERNHQQEEQEKCDQYVSVCSDLKIKISKYELRPQYFCECICVAVGCWLFRQLWVTVS